jgi:hypothetical protein
MCVNVWRRLNASLPVCCGGLGCQTERDRKVRIDYRRCASRRSAQHRRECHKEVSILSGHRVERQEVGTPSEFAEIEAMSRAELIEFILATLESGELALDRKPESPPLLEASKMGLV